MSVAPARSSLLAVRTDDALTGTRSSFANTFLLGWEGVVDAADDELHRDGGQEQAHHTL